MDRGDQAVVVLSRIGAAGLDAPVFFLDQLGAFLGLHRAMHDMPCLKAGAHFPLLPGKPVSEGCLGGFACLLFQWLPLIHELLRLHDRPLCMRRLVAQIRFGSRACRAVFVDAVEESIEAIVVGLCDGIELVRVALRATKREAEPDGAHGVHTIDDVVDAGLFLVASAFAIGHVIAVKTGGDFLLRSGVRQQVAGELFACELVEWFVSVEGLDHVITPGPVCARGVGLKAIGVGVAGGIQPPHGHALAKVRGL